MLMGIVLALSQFFKAKFKEEKKEIDDKQQKFVPGQKALDLPPLQAFESLQSISKKRRFTECIEAIVKLNVDPTKGDQNIRGTCILPAGTGKSVKVCVFADLEFHKDLKEAGADVIGDESVL